MGPMIYLMAAYMVIWILICAFLFSIYSRQRQLQREIELLEQLMESKNKE